MKIRRLPVLLAAFAALANGQSVGRPIPKAAKQVSGKPPSAPPDFDIRRWGADQDSPTAKSFIEDRKASVLEFQRGPAAEDFADARIQFNSFGLPRMIFREGAALSAGSTATAESAARDFLRAHPELFYLSSREVDALRLVSELPVGSGKVVRFNQTVDGLDVVHGTLRILLDSAGKVVQAGAGEIIPGLTMQQKLNLTYTDAIEATLRLLGAEPPFAFEAINGPNGATRYFRGSLSKSANPVSVELVLFPMAATEAVAAYRLHIAQNGSAHEMVIDATTGNLLYRQDLGNSMGQARVWLGSPLVGERQLVDFPEGWIPADGTATTGNNVDAYLDQDGDDEPDESDPPDIVDGRASSESQVFDFPFGDGTVGADPADAPAAAVTNAFYFANRAHDLFADMGFDEAAGNFQMDNFGLGGVAGDPVLVEVQDGFSENNASFRTLPDGMPGRLQIGIFDAVVIGRDPAYSAQIIFHEYTHGATNRLAGGRQNTDCLNGTQSDSTDEGWADYFSNSFTDDPVQGAYLTGQLDRGIRRYSYENYPLTYEDLGNRDFVDIHDEGEIWAGMLWDLRSELGAELVDQLVFDALKVAGCSPDMIESRDDILAAAQVTKGAAIRPVLWEVFARHGMGNSAAGFDGSLLEGTLFNAAFDVPPDLLPGNRSPRVTSRPTSIPGLGDQYVYQIGAADPDGNPLSYELAMGPDGMTVDPQTGAVKWTPDFTAGLAKVAVTDGNGGRLVHGFEIPVLTTLTPNQPITISAPISRPGLAQVVVPQGVLLMQLRMRGGTGDPDVFIASPAGDVAFSVGTGSTETLSFPFPLAGLWLIIVDPFEAYSDVSFEVAFPTPTPISRNATIDGLAGGFSDEAYFAVEIPEGVETFTVSTSGGTGDVDLLLAREIVPTCPLTGFGPCVFDEFSVELDNEESIELMDPEPGTWYLSMTAVESYANVSLTTQVTGDSLLPAIFPGGVALATQTPLIPEISPNSIVTVAGSNFTPGIFAGTMLDADGRVAVNLANTCLEIGGFRSPLFAVTPGQVNAQAHHLLTPGLHDVFLIRDCDSIDEVRSAAGQAAVADVSPGFFHFVNTIEGVNPIATLHGGGPGLVGAPGLLPGAEFTPAEPNEFVSFFGTGFGDFELAIGTGEIPQVALPQTGGVTDLVHPVSMEIDGVAVPPGDLFYAGAAPCCAGLVQLVARIHANARDGDLPLKATVNGVSTPAGSFVTVRRGK